MTQESSTPPETLAGVTATTTSQLSALTPISLGGSSTATPNDGAVSSPNAPGDPTLGGSFCSPYY